MTVEGHAESEEPSKMRVMVIQGGAAWECQWWDKWKGRVWKGWGGRRRKFGPWSQT